MSELNFIKEIPTLCTPSFLCESIPEYYEALFCNQPCKKEYQFMNEDADEWFKVQPNTPFENIFDPNDNFENCFDKNFDNEESSVERFDFDIDNDKDLDDNLKSEIVNPAGESCYSDKADFGLENNASDKIDKKEISNESGSLISTKVDAICEEFKGKRKCSKFLTLSESRKKLALRTDVMNKNFFRAIRREIKNLFDEYLISNELSTSKCKRVFRSNLKRFTENFLEELKQDQKGLKDAISHKTLEKVIGAFISSCATKKILVDEEDSNIVEEFNNILYSYSHQRFYNYLSQPEIKIIIKDVFSKVSTEEFIGRHRALSAFKDSYLGHISSILSNL